MKKVYKFSATWCGPCKMLSKALSSIESPVEIEEVDIEANPELTQQFKIRGVPTLVLVEDDTELKRKVGAMSAEEFLNWIKG
jgi:thiol-disulfide isomerase/thioredoxin